MSTSAPVSWIDSTSWELDFFNLPHHIPWPSEVNPEVANQDPFELDHLLTAVERLGAEAGEPWLTFSRAAAHFDDLADALEDAEVITARELLAQIEEIYPGTAFRLFHQGFVARHEGNDEEALRLYTAAAEKTPNIAPIWNNIGILHAAAGRRDEAIPAFQRALQLTPNDITALEGLTQVRAAVKLMRKMPDGSDAPAYVDLQTFRRMTMEQIDQLAAQPDQLLLFAEQLIRDGLVPDVGLAALEKARELRPDDGRTLFALGGAYRRTGELEKAREALTRLTGLFPDNPSGFLQLAQVCSESSDPAGERQALERVLELDPNQQPAVGIYFGLGAGEHDPKKEEELGRFGEERKSWMAFLLASGITRERGDTARAIRWAERALEIAPESEEVLLHYATVLGEGKDVKKLATVIKPLVESGRFSKRLDWNYAQVLQQLGLRQDAIGVLRKVLTSEVPDDFRKACTATIDAWSGLLTGTGVPLEVHRAGFLQRPVLLKLEDGDGGVVLSAGSPLPVENTFPWRANGGEVTVPLQQGHSGSSPEPRSLGAFRVRGVQPAKEGVTLIDCHLTAMPDGALHFRALQNGRQLPVGWAPQTAAV
jgi:tetratricopeptide (TPR) repeat protein